MGQESLNLDQKQRKYQKPKGKVKVKVAQSCPTLCDSVDYTVHGILQIMKRTKVSAKKKDHPVGESEMEYFKLSVKYRYA